MEAFYVSSCKIKLERIEPLVVHVQVEPERGICEFSVEGGVLSNQRILSATVEFLDANAVGALIVKTQYGESIRLTFMGSDYLMGEKLGSKHFINQEQLIGWYR